jgi:hypothetical protein
MRLSLRGLNSLLVIGFLDGDEEFHAAYRNPQIGASIASAGIYVSSMISTRRIQKVLNLRSQVVSLHLLAHHFTPDTSDAGTPLRGHCGFWHVCSLVGGQTQPCDTGADHTRSPGYWRAGGTGGNGGIEQTGDRQSRKSKNLAHAITHRLSLLP